MECKLKALLTSWLPWKPLNKSENLYYFPAHLSLFFMYWFFLRLLSALEIKQDRFMPSWKETKLDWKDVSPSGNPSTPHCPSPSPGGLQLSGCTGAFGKHSPVGVRCAAFPLHCLPPAASPPKDLPLIHAQGTYLHNIPGTPTFHTAPQGV